MAISWRLTLALAKASYPLLLLLLLFLFYCCCQCVACFSWPQRSWHSEKARGEWRRGAEGSATVKRLERWQFRESPHSTWQRWQLTELALNGYADVVVDVDVVAEADADVGAFWPSCLPLRRDRQRHLTASLAGGARQRQRNFLSVWLLLLLLLLLLLCSLPQWNVTNRVSVTEIKRLRVWQINWHDQVHPLATTLPPTLPYPPSATRSRHIPIKLD